jgi:cytoskeletal protein CcmA (bactofilin family)
VFEKIISKNSGDSAPSPGRPSPPAPAAPAPAATGGSAPTPVRSVPTSGQRNVLLPDVEIKGNVRFQDALVVDGKIEGEIVSDGALTIGEPAKIKAEIKTRSVVVYGKVHGNIIATERVELKKDSEVLGDIRTAVLSMEAGATFVGNSTVGANAVSSAPAPKSEKKDNSPGNSNKPGNGNKPGGGGQHQQGKLAGTS